MAVAKEELAGSPTLHIERRKGSGKMIFRIAWDAIDDFAYEVFPPPYVAGRRIIIPKVLSFPNYLFNLAQSIDIEPMDPNSPRGNREYPNFYVSGAKATISFATPDFDQDNAQGDTQAGNDAQTFVSYKTHIGGEFLTYPSSALAWSQPSDTTIAESPGSPTPTKNFSVSEDAQVSVIVPLIDHTLTWPTVPFPPWSAIRQCIGKVNAYPFSGAPRETLLYLGADGSRDITSRGIRMWNLEYKFNEKNQNPLNPSDPQGWNHFLRPDGPSAGKFMRLKRKIAGGYTTVRNPATAGDATFNVVSAQGFPAGGEYRIKIGANSYTVTAGFGTNTWTVDPVLAANLSVGQSVGQSFYTTLTAALTKTASKVSVADRRPFPRTGQFIIKIDNELLAVTSGHYTNVAAGDFTVLRGVLGSEAVAHDNGSSVYQDSSPIYDLADFRLLFLSGLITG